MQIEQRYLRVQGKNIWVKSIRHPEKRDLPTLVFLHDALGSVAQWKGFPSLIAEHTGYDVVIYDRPGHGLSDPNEDARGLKFFEEEAYFVLPEMLEKLHIQEPVLYGHSDGGTIALMFASKFQAKGLILEAAHVMAEEITQSGVIHTTKNAVEITSLLEKYHGEKTKQLFGTWSEIWTGISVEEWNIEHLLGNVTSPTLIIQGNDDNYATEEQVVRIARGISGLYEIFMVDDCGHFPHKEVPGGIIHKVDSFLKNFISQKNNYEI